MQYTDFNEIRVGKNNTYVKRKKERESVCVCVCGGGDDDEEDASGGENSIYEVSVKSIPFYPSALSRCSTSVLRKAVSASVGSVTTHLCNVRLQEKDISYTDLVFMRPHLDFLCICGDNSYVDGPFRLSGREQFR